MLKCFEVPEDAYSQRLTISQTIFQRSQQVVYLSLHFRLSLKKRTWGAPRREATGPVPQVTSSSVILDEAVRRAPQTHLSRGECAALFLPHGISWW